MFQRCRIIFSSVLRDGDFLLYYLSLHVFLLHIHTLLLAGTRVKGLSVYLKEGWAWRSERGYKSNTDSLHM